MLVSEPAGLEGMMKDGTAHVLIDLRDPKTAAQGFIKGSISVPADKLATSKDLFPADKAAPVILVGDPQASDEAFSTVRGWGYSNTSVLRGGITSWKGELQKGQMASKIEYVRRLKPGEITISEFKSAVQNRPANTLIIDVREGVVDGRLPEALYIPSNELEARLAEIPKEKAIIIYCNTGILAKMAYTTLNEKGYSNVRYLNAVIQVAKDGSYEIAEK